MQWLRGGDVAEHEAPIVRGFVFKLSWRRCVVVEFPFMEGIMKPTVTEQTSKRYKGRMLIGALIACAGVVMMVGSESPMYGALTMAAGFVVYLAARMSAWWNHG